jgi:hypothetical protein
MNRTGAMAVLWLLVAVVGADPDLRADEAAEKAAQSAAKAWLGLVDQGNYAASWDAAAAYFRNAVSKEQWLQSMKGARQPLGSLQSRKFLSARFTATLPGAPDGRYVVIQYATTFENKASAVETVTPMQDPDGRWRVSGYFIK